MIRKQIITRGILSFLVLCLAFFLPARTLKYWEGWGYIGIICVCAVGTITYFLKYDPALLERRMRIKEKEKEQKHIIRIASMLFLPTFIIPGFDHFYKWSEIPVLLIITGEILVLAGYLIVIRVFRENSYTSRIIEVNPGQKVISSGPYSVVRHPMYSGTMLMYGFTPLALGSWWAFIGSGMIFILIIFRIITEERFLSDNLEGYKEYLQKTRYRLIPGIW